jgi:hypothetical protein
MEIRMPHQAFINGNFVDSTSEKTFKTINPHDESVRKIPILDHHVEISFSGSSDTNHGSLL